MVDEVEAAGEICRDEGGSGVATFGATAAQDTAAGGEVRWWTNVFRGYAWDGQEYESGLLQASA